MIFQIQKQRDHKRKSQDARTTVKNTQGIVRST